MPESPALHHSLDEFGADQARHIDTLIAQGVELTERMAEAQQRIDVLGADLGNTLEPLFAANQRTMTLARPTGTAVVKRNIEAKVDKKALQERKDQVAALGFPVAERRSEMVLRPEMLEQLRTIVGDTTFAELVGLKLTDTKLRKMEKSLPPGAKLSQYARSVKAGDPAPTKHALEALDNGEGYTARQVQELRRVIKRVEKPATATFTPPVVAEPQQAA